MAPKDAAVPVEGSESGAAPMCRAMAQRWAFYADAMRGEADDPTHGAHFYHADYVSPRWKDRMTKIASIGQHLFYHH